MNFYRILTILNSLQCIYFSFQEDKEDDITAAGGGTDEYASTMSTHPQSGRAASQSFKTHMPKNAAALHTP